MKQSGSLHNKKWKSTQQDQYETKWMSTKDQYETKWKSTQQHKYETKWISTQQGRVIFYMHSVLSEKGCISDAFL